MSLLGTFGKVLDVFPEGYRLGNRVGPGIKLVVYARVVGIRLRWVVFLGIMIGQEIVGLAIVK
jgi:hypothetical protein